MIINPPHLMAEYRQMVKGKSADQEYCDWAHLWYLNECSKLGDTRIWEVRRRVPRLEGFGYIAQYLAGEINGRVFYNCIRNQIFDSYYKCLWQAGVIPPPPPMSEVVALMKIEALEAVKAYTPLIGMDPQTPEACAALTPVIGVTWHHFVETLHALLDLPSVAEIADGLTLLVNGEGPIIESGDFLAYVLTMQDWIAFAEEIELQPNEYP